MKLVSVPNSGTRLLRADEARQRLLDQFVWADAEERGHHVVGLQDLTFRDEHWVWGIGNDDVSIKGAARFAAPTVALVHDTLRKVRTALKHFPSRDVVGLAPIFRFRGCFKLDRKPRHLLSEHRSTAAVARFNRVIVDFHTPVAELLSGMPAPCRGNAMRVPSIANQRLATTSSSISVAADNSNCQQDGVFGTSGL